MGCGCGGGAKRSSVSSQGTNPSNPIIYGSDDAALPVRRVVHVTGSAGMPAGATRYARGTEVASMLENGVLRATDGGRF